MQRGISRLRCNEGIPKGSLTKRVYLTVHTLLPFYLPCRRRKHGSHKRFTSIFSPPFVYPNSSHPNAAWRPMRSQRSRPVRWVSQARRRSASAAAAGAGASAAYRPARHTQGDKDAQNGWYRYDTQFAVPILNAKKAIDHYTVYGGTLLIRNDADGKSYLYDLLDVEKKKVISKTSFSAETHSEVTSPKPSDTSILTDGENVKQQLPLKAPAGR